MTTDKNIERKHVAEMAAIAPTALDSVDFMMRGTRPDLHQVPAEHACKALGLLGHLISVLTAARGISLQEVDAPGCYDEHAKDLVRQVAAGREDLCCVTDVRSALDAAVMMMADLFQTRYGGLDSWRALTSVLLFQPAAENPRPF